MISGISFDETLASERVNPNTCNEIFELTPELAKPGNVVKIKEKFTFEPPIFKKNGNLDNSNSFEAYVEKFNAPVAILNEREIEVTVPYGNLEDKLKPNETAQLDLVFLKSRMLVRLKENGFPGGFEEKFLKICTFQLEIVFSDIIDQVIQIKRKKLRGKEKPTDDEIEEMQERVISFLTSNQTIIEKAAKGESYQFDLVQRERLEREEHFDQKFVDRISGDVAFVTVGTTLVALRETKELLPAAMFTFALVPKPFIRPSSAGFWRNFDERLGLSIGSSLKEATSTSGETVDGKEKEVSLLLFGIALEINQRLKFQFGSAVESIGGSKFGNSQLFYALTSEIFNLKNLSFIPSQ